MRGRRNKADCINCLVELEAFNFWKQCSLSRLQAILHEKQLTPPTTFTVDAYARALAQSDTAAGRVHTWNNRTVRELRAALIVNQIPYASNERKWNLINLLISANIEPPQLPGASMIVRTSQRPNEPNNSGVGGPLVESWVSMPPRSRASSRSALGASATMASVNTQHVAENHSRMSSPPVLALQRSPSLLSAGGRPIASALHSVPATALDLSVPEQTLERGPVPDRTARPSAQAGGDLQDALSTLRRAWDAMTAGQLERCRDQFYATLSAPKDDSNVNDGALTQHLQDLLPELDERIRDKYLKTSSVVSANVVNSPASGNITTTSSRPLQITYPPLSTSSPLHTRSDRHDDHVLDPRLASSTPPPLSPRRPIQPIGTPRPSGPLRPTPASMSTSSSTAIASHHHSPLRRPTLDDTLAFPNPREYLAALPTTPYDELLRRGQSLVPRSSLASGEEYENPPNPPSSVVSAIPGTWPLEGHLQAQDTAANRSPGSSADTSYPPLPAADEAFLQVGSRPRLRFQSNIGAGSNPLPRRVSS